MQSTGLPHTLFLLLSPKQTECMMGSFRRPRPRFMSSPVLSDLARFHASSPALQISNTRVWNRYEDRNVVCSNQFQVWLITDQRTCHYRFLALSDFSSDWSNDQVQKLVLFAPLVSKSFTQINLSDTKWPQGAAATGQTFIGLWNWGVFKSPASAVKDEHPQSDWGCWSPRWLFGLLLWAGCETGSGSEVTSCGVEHHISQHRHLFFNNNIRVEVINWLCVCVCVPQRPISCHQSV